MSGADRGQGRGSFVKAGHLAFVLGDPNHGQAIVLGQGAAEAAVTMGTNIGSMSIGEALKALRTDAENNGTVDWNPDGTPIRGDKRGHERDAGRSGLATDPPGYGNMGGE